MLALLTQCDLGQGVPVPGTEPTLELSTQEGGWVVGLDPPLAVEQGVDPVFLLELFEVVAKSPISPGGVVRPLPGLDGAASVGARHGRVSVRGHIARDRFAGSP